MTEQEPLTEETTSTSLSRDLIATVQGISILGQIAAKGLLAYGQITFFLSAEDTVEIAPTREVSLDALPELSALQLLTDAGYTNSQLGVYLKGRDARRNRTT